MLLHPGGVVLAEEVRADAQGPPLGDQNESPVIIAMAVILVQEAGIKCEFNMDSLSKPELLTLLSIMEGELEARDLVIETLRARRKEVFVQERYGQYSLTDPFLALQRDFDGRAPGADKERRPLGSSPVSVLEAVMAHCRKMQERMSAQLAAAETRQKRARRKEVFVQERYGQYSLTDPFLALQRDFDGRAPGADKERRPLGSSPVSVLEAVMAHCRKMQERMSAQLAAAETRQKRLKEEREKNKHIVMMLVRECKQLATRVRAEQLQGAAGPGGRGLGRPPGGAGLRAAARPADGGKMEKQLSELDTEREQLRAPAGREEAESLGLRRQVEHLRTRQQPADSGGSSVAAPSPRLLLFFAPKPLCSVAVATEPISSRTVPARRTSPPAEVEGPKKTPLSNPRSNPSASPGDGSTAARESLAHDGEMARRLSAAPRACPAGARYKFQEQDQNGSAFAEPAVPRLSPTNTRQLCGQAAGARHTVTQVLSRFTSPPAGGAGRPGPAHSASEGGLSPDCVGHPIGLKWVPAPCPSPGLRTRASAAASISMCRVSPAIILPSPLPPLATSKTAPWHQHQGWCTSVAACGRRPGGGPTGLDSGSPPLLLQAASQGNVTLLSMLLNPPDPIDAYRRHDDPSPRRAAPHSHTPHDLDDPDDHDDDAASSPEHEPHLPVPDLDQPLLLHSQQFQNSALAAAAQNGHPVSPVAPGGRTPLYLASQAGSPDSVRVLLGSGADRSQTTDDSCTVLHAAVRSGHVDTLRLLLCHPLPGEAPAVTFDPCILALPADLLNQANTDGWTAAHMAAASGLKVSPRLGSCFLQRMLL
ncbi:hypothetical protein CRUP_030365 [Coryphaenoides rupestris]|nr:hypothetical protein CRUP_030365 [Coryphaenoides rupestris]